MTYPINQSKKEKKPDCAILSSQLIQDEIKALVQLQKRQSGAQSNPLYPTKTLEPPTDLENEIQACSPSKVTANPQESSDEGLVTVQSSGYGTLSTWEPGTTTSGSLEGKDEVLSLQKKQDSGTSHSLSTKTQGLDRVPSRTVTSNKSPHTTSNVPNLPANKQRLNRWEAFQWETSFIFVPSYIKPNTAIEI